jgi:hypothetical protein
LKQKIILHSLLFVFLLGCFLIPAKTVSAAPLEQYETEQVVFCWKNVFGKETCQPVGLFFNKDITVTWKPALNGPAQAMPRWTVEYENYNFEIPATSFTVKTTISWVEVTSLVADKPDQGNPIAISYHGETIFKYYSIFPQNTNVITFHTDMYGLPK